jgi:hypothetical protein
MAESILRQFAGDVMSVGYWVDCSDPVRRQHS